MKLWLSKNNEIPLREQITRQIMLAIRCGDLLPAQKLPSVREIALRYDVHPNTVSAAYRWLEENNWVSSKHGSGVFVREHATSEFEGENDSELDFLISEFFQIARRRGFSNRQIKTKLTERFSRPQAETILIVEPDEDLREILREEIAAATNLPVSDFSKQKIGRNAVAVALNEIEARKILPGNVPLVVLQLNSVQDSMRGKTRPQTGELIGVVSGWEKFLLWAQTMLLAAGIEAEQIVVRNRKENDWQKGLNECRFVIADSYTARRLPAIWDVRVFKLISPRSLAELENLVS